MNYQINITAKKKNASEKDIQIETKPGFSFDLL